MSLLDLNRPYTFSEIAFLKAPTDELLAEYGLPTDLEPLTRILVAALLSN